MKNTIYLFAILLCYLPLKAQQIIFKGVLYEHNSKTNTGKLKAIQNAQIIIPFTVPSTTDNMGKFKTESDGYKLGQTTKIIVRKLGYEVVNEKDLENIVAGSLDELKVFLAPQNLLYEAQLKYYNLAKKSIETSYDSKLNKLITELNKNRSANQDNKEAFDTYFKNYTYKSQDLEIERNNALKSAQDVAKNIAEINLDFADNLYKKAIGYFLKGNIDSCLILLNSNQFSKQEKKAIANINKLNESINQEAQILKTIIDKDLFRAQLYQTKLQMDSVSSICKKASELNFKYVDAIGIKEFISINKKIIDIDPNYTFSWLNNDYFEDFISTVRLKSGRGSLDEAEAFRLQGVFKMKIGEELSSYEDFNKSLEILRKNKSNDSALVIMNLLDHSLKYYVEGRRIYYWNLIHQFYVNNNYFQFSNNPYIYELLYKNSNDIQFAFLKYLEVVETFEINRFGSVNTNILSYVLSPENKRTYSTETINKLKFGVIEDNFNRENYLTLEQYDLINEYSNQINKNTVQYIDFIFKVSKLFLKEITQTKDNINSKKSARRVLEFSNNIMSIFLNNKYYENLTIEDKYKYELSKGVFMFINLTSVQIQNDTFNILSKLTDFRNQLNELNKQGTLFSSNHQYTNPFINSFEVLYRLNYWFVGCDLFKWPNNFIEVSKLLSAAKRVNGTYIFKDILLNLSKCDKAIINDSNYLNLLDTLISHIYSPGILNFDTNLKYFGVRLDPIIDNNSNYFTNYNITFDINNGFKDYYLGSDYSIKCGGIGEIIKLNKFDIQEIKSKSISFSNIKSIYWKEYNQNLLNGIIRNDLFDSIKINSLSKFMRKNTIDTLIYIANNSVKQCHNVYKTNLTPSFNVYNEDGNSALYMLDFLFYKRIELYNKRGDYARVINIVKEFNNLGLPQFFRGYAKRIGKPEIYLACIYYFGIKASIINNDLNSLQLFKEQYFKLYSQLTQKNKLIYLNEFLNCINSFSYSTINGKLAPVNFGDTIFQNMFKELQNLLEYKYDLTDSMDIESFYFNSNYNNLMVNSYLTLTESPNIKNLNYSIIELLKQKYPTEARVFRNEALYYLLQNNFELAKASLKISKSLGFNRQDLNFFLDKIEIKKYHSKILECFN